MRGYKSTKKRRDREEESKRKGTSEFSTTTYDQREPKSTTPQKWMRAIETKTNER